MGLNFKKIIFILAAGILCASARPCSLARDYRIKFNAHTCIKPYNAYNYVTCHTIPVTINKTKIFIPKNFETDLASIPRWLWPIVAPAHSKLMQASILHDYLYAEPEGFNRKEIDSIFYDVLVNNGVDKTHAYLMYSAVRLFGGSHFNYAEVAGHHVKRLLNIHGKT